MAKEQKGNGFVNSEIDPYEQSTCPSPWKLTNIGVAVYPNRVEYTDISALFQIRRNVMHLLCNFDRNLVNPDEVGENRYQTAFTDCT